MAYTITITNNSPQALAFVEYVKTLSFVKFTETQSKEKAPAKAKTKAGLAKPAYDDLEEDEYGMPITYRDEIMTLSKKVNKAVAKRWDEALAKRNKKEKI